MQYALYTVPLKVNGLLLQVLSSERTSRSMRVLPFEFEYHIFSSAALLENTSLTCRRRRRGREARRGGAAGEGGGGRRAAIAAARAPEPHAAHDVADGGRGVLAERSGRRRDVRARRAPPTSQEAPRRVRVE